MTCCSVPKCQNKTEQGYRLYRFPADKVRRLKWIQNMKRFNWQPTSGARICHIHFDASQFEKNRQDNKIKLTPNAVPTLFHGSKLKLEIDSQEEQSKMVQVETQSKTAAMMETIEYALNQIGDINFAVAFVELYVDNNKSS